MVVEGECTLRVFYWSRRITKEPTPFRHTLILLCDNERRVPKKGCRAAITGSGNVFVLLFRNLHACCRLLSTAVLHRGQFLAMHTQHHTPPTHRAFFVFVLNNCFNGCSSYSISTWVAPIIATTINTISTVISYAYSNSSD